MNSPGTFATKSPLASLRKLVPAKADAEGCGLCNVALTADHAHLIEPRSRKIICACRSCAILFDSQQAAKYRRVGGAVRVLADFCQSEAQWDDLGVPIGLAFFCYSTAHAQTIALYPGPAGLTEAKVDSRVWNELTEQNPTLKSLAPDVEALLINRIKQAREHYLVPIDACFRLTGMIRRSWRGLSGGAQVWRDIDGFFTDLRRVAARSEKSRA